MATPFLAIAPLVPARAPLHHHHPASGTILEEVAPALFLIQSRAAVPIDLGIDEIGLLVHPVVPAEPALLLASPWGSLKTDHQE
jgi:hypothetical protein